MDGTGQEGKYNFFLTTTGHRAHGAANPRYPAGAAHAVTDYTLTAHMKSRGRGYQLF